MKKFLLLSAALSSMLLAKTITFDEALKEALSNNLELKAKKLNIDKAKADLKQAKGMDWGKLTFSEEISRTNNAMYVFGMKLESREATFRDFGFADFLGGVAQVLQASPDYDTFKSYMTNPAMAAQLLNTAPKDLNYPGSRTNFKTKFVYEVPLFTGYKLTYAKEMAKLQIKANKYKYAHDKNKLAIEVLKAYNGAVAAKSFVNALETAKKTTTSFINMISAFYKNGMATKTDLLEAKKRDNEVNAMLIEAKNKYKLALAYLRFLTDDNEISDVGDFKIIIPQNASLKELQKIALQNRNDLKWMKSNLKTMEKKVKFDKADKYPMVGAHLEYGWNDNALNNISADKDYYLIAAGLKWNILDKSTDAKVEKSKIEANQVALYYGYMKKGIKLDVEQKYLDYKAKKAVVNEKLTNKELAEEILKKYTYMYKQGMINITILLMKEAEARKARAELIKARYDEALAAAKLKEALGDLVKESK
ncbi:TolC family protein [Caminibacter pacificus]|uniref:Outer membrane protein TolC n=1 Tax=Caminibacter pacificus TaxID=1424653 RepID=A0AAJ4RBZ4_9BACT|nr:TolC family protein [Caminibacter pacificus]NPA88182.1 TolC family protein [Campylobacterota bacterium]QCI28887.1 TolC family protein [Caminibacter pacificus]ROR39478.1 outer membrane protein TolC [Caminibacter pacificus]